MSTDIQIFTNQEFNKDIRAIEINGEPWFVGKDIVEALGYSDTDKAIRTHVDQDDKRILNPADLAGLRNNANFQIDSPRGLTFINEAGLYSLVMSSKLPNAKVFKRWVVKEVLPQLRKTGMYKVGDKVPQTFLEALELAVEKEKERLALEAAYKDEKKRADENQDVKDLYDTSVAQNNYWIEMKAVADILDVIGIGRTNLYRFLRDEGVLTSKNEPMRQYQELGLMKTSYYSDWLGQYVCVVSFKGLKFIFKKLKHANKIPRSTTFEDWVALCRDMAVENDKSENMITE